MYDVINYLLQRSLTGNATMVSHKSYFFRLLEIRSVERGICPIATSTMNELFL